MIHVVVGTSHLSAILGYGDTNYSPSFERFDSLHKELRERLRPLFGAPVCTGRDLKTVTVFDALREFHTKASTCLQEPSLARILSRLRREVRLFGRKEYHYPEFEVTFEELSNYLAVAGPLRHGTILEEGHPVSVFLPDFSVAVRYYGFFAQPAEGRRWAKQTADAQQSIRLLDDLTNPTLLTCLTRLRDSLPKRDDFTLLAETLYSIGKPEDHGAVPQLDRLRPLLHLAVGRMEQESKEEVDDTVPNLLSNRCLRTPEELEFHLCDSLQFICDRVRHYCEPFRQRIEVCTSQLEQDTITEDTRHFLESELAGKEKKTAELLQRLSRPFHSESVAVSCRNRHTAITRECEDIKHQLTTTSLTAAVRALLEQWKNVAEERVPMRGAEETLVIDARVSGFAAHRSLHRARRKHRDIPLVGEHHLLAGQATRQGIGKPIISGICPIDLWRYLDSPVKHFLLNGAQVAGVTISRPVYPNLPSNEEMSRLEEAASSARANWQYGPQPHEQASSLNPDEFDSTLRKLGLRSAVRRLSCPHTVHDRLLKRQRAFDWAEAIGEYEASIYGYSIEQSLRLQGVLDLYPLHKRVLGLIEYTLVPKLKKRELSGSKKKTLSGQASTVWGDAFTEPLIDRPALSLPKQCDWWGTLEAKGNWVLIADAASGDCLEFATLLDSILSQLMQAPELAGTTVTFTPKSPSDQAHQLNVLADSNDPPAVYLTYYLGKLIIQLRNAIEHGIDQPDNGALKIDCSEAWNGPTGLKSLQEKANENSWRLKSELGKIKDTPPSAKALLLTPSSLHRCLVLVSLVLHAARSHLGM